MPRQIFSDIGMIIMMMITLDPNVSRCLFFSLLVYHFTFAASENVMYGEKYNKICQAPYGLKATWFYENDGVQSHVEDCQTITNTDITNKVHVTFCQESGTDAENQFTTTLTTKAASFSDARLYYCKDSDGEYLKTINPDVISEY